MRGPEVEMHMDMSQQAFETEIDGENAVPDALAQRFVRVYAVDMSQESEWKFVGKMSRPKTATQACMFSANLRGRNFSRTYRRNHWAIYKKCFPAGPWNPLCASLRR